MAKVEMETITPSTRSVLMPWKKSPGKTLRETFEVSGPVNKWVEGVGSMVFRTPESPDVVKAEVRYAGRLRNDSNGIKHIEIDRSLHRDSEELVLGPDNPLTVIISGKTKARTTIKLLLTS